MSTHSFHNRILRPLRKKLGLDVRLTFQVLRRSMLQGTSARRRTQAHLGHRSIVTTMDIYAQEIPASVRKMVEEEDEAAVLMGLGVPSSELEAV